MISSGGGTSAALTSSGSLFVQWGGRQGLRTRLGDDDRLLYVQGADAFLPDVGDQREDHARLNVLLDGGEGKSVRDERKVETEPQPPGYRHGRLRNARGVIRAEEIGQRRPHPAGVQEPLPEP